LGNFQASQKAISEARELMQNIPEAAQCERILTAINNKSQIEISGRSSAGNINTAATLPDRIEKCEDVEEEKQVNVDHCQIDPKYDWY
jgi:hypothetical protein